MRPARKGPENGGQHGMGRDQRLASMRPARKGPENAIEDGDRTRAAMLQ